MQRPNGGHGMANGQTRMSEHEARSAILGELHARPFLPVEAPRRVYHFAFATSDEEARADRRAILALCEASGEKARRRMPNFITSHWATRSCGDGVTQRISRNGSADRAEVALAAGFLPDARRTGLREVRWLD